MSDVQLELILPEIEPTGDFAYEALDKDDCLQLRVAEDKIRTLVRRTVDCYVSIGLELIDQRERLRGGFLAWCRSAFGWGTGEVYRHIYAAEHLGECSELGNFYFRCLSLFTTKGIPQAAVDAAIALAMSGQMVDRGDVQQLIDQHREQGDADATTDTDPGDEALATDSDPDGGDLTEVTDPGDGAAADPVSDDDDSEGENDDVSDASADEPENDEPEIDDVSHRPFAQLPELPEEIDGPFNELKLSILRLKLTDWRDFSRDHMLTTLDCLRAFVLAPKE